MATCLVTGGAGFIGSHMVAALMQRGDRVRVLDNLSTGFSRNLDALPDEVELVQGSVSDPQAVTQAMRDVELVFHLAALPSVPRSIEDPLGSHEANATGTLRVLLAARDAGARRVVVAASSSAYGDVESGAKAESLPVQPLSPYALQKVYSEYLVRHFHQFYGLEAVALRYFNVFGPRQDPNSLYSAVIPLFIGWLMDGKPVRIYGDGEQRRDFTHVENVVRANLLAAEAVDAPGCVLNVGSGASTSVNQLAVQLADIMDKPLRVEYQPPRAGDVRDSLADLTQAHAVLGYQPQTGLREGLEQTVAWYLGRDAL